jgi:KUP system potassium uptake protein
VVFVVFPALTLEYLGQGGLILHEPSTISNPFFLLLPSWARLPMVVLATAATVIASQAVISGAYSVSRQASQLGLLPPLTVRQTSTESAGQIYLPVVNAALFLGVLVLMLAFRSSGKLATAYGISVTGALLVDTILLLFVARARWKWSVRRLVLAGAVFGGTEVLFLSANLTKVTHGGWLPLVIALVVFTVMTTWQRGRHAVTANRVTREGSLAEFLDTVQRDGVQRVPGTAVFPHPTKDTTPLALRANVERNCVLHERVIIISAHARTTPHVAADDALTVDHLGSEADGVVHVTLQYGFFDRPDIPRALAHLQAADHPEVDVDPSTASYFVSRATLRAGPGSGWRRWRKRLFIVLARNAADPASVFALPADRTVVMGSEIEV